MHSSSIILPPNCSSLLKRSHKNQLQKLCFQPLKNLRFCGLRNETLAFSFSKLKRCEAQREKNFQRKKVISASVLVENGNAPTSFDYDLVIIGAGVGGHGAALHAVEKVRLICVVGI